VPAPPLLPLAPPVVARRPPRRGPALALLVSAAAAGSALLAAPASGDVLRFDSFERESKRGSVPTLLSLDGGRRTLAPVPWGRFHDPVKDLTVSPDGTRVAITVGTRLVLLPTDGGPAVTLRDPALRLGPPAPGWAGVGTTSTWWNADGTALTTGPLETRGGRTAVRRCTVAPVRCRTEVLRDTRVVGGLPDGRLLVTQTHGVLRPASDGAYVGWAARGAGWVRRMRTLLRRPRTTTLWAEPAAGSAARVAWRGRLRPSDGVPRFQALVPTGPSSGALLQFETLRLRLQTRRRDGRLQARVIPRSGAAAIWRITPDARRRTLPAPANQTIQRFASPAGGWFGTVVRTFRDDTRSSLPAHIAPDGRVDEIRVGGRPLVSRSLHDALGRPAARRIPPPDPDFGEGEAEVRIVGFERVTNSLVVVYDEADGQGLARVPVDGRPPVLIEFVPESLPTYFAW
jgi:hypothetical protein